MKCDGYYVQKKKKKKKVCILSGTINKGQFIDKQDKM